MDAIFKIFVMLYRRHDEIREWAFERLKLAPSKTPAICSLDSCLTAGCGAPYTDVEMPYDLLSSAFKAVGLALVLCTLSACASSDLVKINKCIQGEEMTAECNLAIQTQIETLVDEQDEEYLKRFTPSEAYELALEYAERDEYSRAQTFLNHSYRDNERRDWNLLIDAQRAFLSRDEAALKAVREEMLASEIPEVFRDQFKTLADQYNSNPSHQTERFLVPLKELRWPPYLEIVDGLIACFDAPFAKAYSFECRP